VLFLVKGASIRLRRSIPSQELIMAALKVLRMADQRERLEASLLHKEEGRTSSTHGRALRHGLY